MTTESARAACDRDLLTKVVALRAPPPTSSVINDWAKYQVRREQALHAVVDQMYTSYRLGMSVVAGDCMSEAELREIDPHLSEVFVSRSVDELERSHEPELKKFAAKIRASIASNQLLLFKFVGHRPDDLTNETLPAGFHRGQGSIFFDFAKIDRDDWLIYFVHEVAHRFDTHLTEAIQTYSQLDQVQDLVKTQRALSSQDQALADKVLIAGMNRGYLAEVRAWSFTARIYELGLKDELWPRRAWMDHILYERQPQESYDAFWLRYLDSRFTDPDVPPFNTALIKPRLDAIRAQIRKSRQLPN